LNGVSLLINGEGDIQEIDFTAVDATNHHFAEILIAFGLTHQHGEWFINIHIGRSFRIKNEFS
jgi:hypothetical protein